MFAAGCTIKQLDAALDSLKTCRASDKEYIVASEVVLAEMEKLGPVVPNTPVVLKILYQKLTQELLYAEKCAELRRPAVVNKTVTQTSKY